MFLSWPLQDRLPLNLHMNKQPEKNSSPAVREQKFFSRLSKTIIKKLQALYIDDFQMFGYDGVEKYMAYGIDA